MSQTLKAVEGTIRGSEEGLQSRPGVSIGVHDELLAEPAMCEQFVGLLCQFEPSAVLPFLQSHDSYRSPTAIPAAAPAAALASTPTATPAALSAVCTASANSTAWAGPV